MLKNINLKRSFAISRLNLNRLLVVISIFAGVSIANEISEYIQLKLWTKMGNQTISSSNFLFGICVLPPIFLASTSFYKTMRLNVKKKDWFLSALITLGVLAAAVALIHTLWFYSIVRPINKVDPFVKDPTGKTEGSGYEMLSLYEVFGFAEYGAIVGFAQTLGFLFFCSVFIFMLTSLQDKWLGWLVDVIIVACISVFSSIAILRKHIWGPFFRALIFATPALQISFTILGGIALYMLYLPVLKRKKL